MNERIREIADEAKMSTYLLAYGLEFNISIEKFAELIVRECIEVCGSVVAVKAGYNDADGRDTAYSCGDQIKEHFGVEE